MEYMEEKATAAKTAKKGVKELSKLRKHIGKHAKKYLAGSGIAGSYPGYKIGERSDKKKGYETARDKYDIYRQMVQDEKSKQKRRDELQKKVY